MRQQLDTRVNNDFNRLYKAACINTQNRVIMLVYQGGVYAQRRAVGIFG